MLAEEGAGSFFTGIVPRVGRVAPYLALSLTSYEIIKVMAHQSRTNFEPFLPASCLVVEAANRCTAYTYK